MYKIYVDGGSRGNPGIAGCGVYDPQQENGFYFFLGKVTNNEAEYNGLLNALKKYKDKQNLSIFTDSQLMCKQINGEYQVKSENLLPLYAQCMKLIKGFKKFKITDVRRKFNKEADLLANYAMDKKKSGRARLVEKD